MDERINRKSLIVSLAWVDCWVVTKVQYTHGKVVRGLIGMLRTEGLHDPWNSTGIGGSRSTQAHRCETGAMAAHRGTGKSETRSRSRRVMRMRGGSESPETRSLRHFRRFPLGETQTSSSYTVSLLSLSLSISLSLFLCPLRTPIYS